MMFREKSISKFYAFTRWRAVFALTLTGCGGSAMMDMRCSEMPTAVDPVDSDARRLRLIACAGSGSRCG